MLRKGEYVHVPEVGEMRIENIKVVGDIREILLVETADKGFDKAMAIMTESEVFALWT